MVNIKRDQIVGAILLALGIFVIVMVNQFTVPFTADYPGPRALPGIAGIGLIICGFGIFLKSTFDKSEQKAFLVRAQWIRLGIEIASLIAYVALMKIFGFLVTTPFYCYWLCTRFAGKAVPARKSRILYSVLVTVILYVVYKFMFSFPMPEPMFF